MEKSTKQSFDRISRELTRNKDLNDSGYRLMVLILNNTKDWKINLTYFSNLLGWSKGKLSRTTKHIIELGLIKKTKINLGSKGFTYEYEIISTPKVITETPVEAIKIEKVIPTIKVESKVVKAKEKELLSISRLNHYTSILGDNPTNFVISEAFLNMIKDKFGVPDYIIEVLKDDVDGTPYSIEEIYHIILEINREEKQVTESEKELLDEIFNTNY